MTDRDTIFARASGAGKAGVAVFRLSGADARRIAGDLIDGREIDRSARLISVTDPLSWAMIDRGLALLFAAPNSFTGEDTVEFQLHGSRAVEEALYAALSAAGARPAEPGEFTMRALKNGKLDLAQVEALADLIDAETTTQRMQALGQLDGRLSSLAEGWRQQILAVMTPLEADIDFPDEEDVPAAIAAKAKPAMQSLKETLKSYLDAANGAQRIREGASIAVIGPPNAGKSSLVNALAGSDVAIVSDIAGTTRDIVETRLDLNGVLTIIADTAGIRAETSDVIEQEGIARAQRRARDADIRLLVLDPEGEHPIEALSLLRDGDYLVWSKADKNVSPPELAISEAINAVLVSSTTHGGIAELITRLGTSVSRETSIDEPALTRQRHVYAVTDAVAALERAEANLDVAAELAAEDARMAARALGQITGAVGVEDVLGEIFSTFCIGK